MAAHAALAIHCLAYGGGIPIEVETDYLPERLLERGWLGEFGAHGCEYPQRETANGSRRFDQLRRDKDGHLVIVEAKSPDARLDWRHGNGLQDSGTIAKTGDHGVRAVFSTLGPSSSISRFSKENALAAFIDRPPFPTGNAEKGIAVLQQNTQKLIDGLEADSIDLGDAGRITLTLAQSRCLLDPEAAIYPTWDAWVTAMQIGSAVFAAAATTEEHVRCRIAHKERVLRATGPQWYVTPGSWTTAFYLAAICRERDRITALCQVPMSLLRENGSRWEEYHYAWIESLRAYWLGSQDLGEKLVAAVDGTDPEAVTDPETVGKLLYPPMEMFHRLIRKDHAGFNQALANALQWHKEYWSEESRTFQASGLVALAPLAIACFAYDAGIAIEVESDYLPIALLERNWCGEFPT
ncbi:Imm49 family immunity protein [Streptomyces sp. CMSTAAHL-2]|uniref:Imm49 family immunity protein n=1 Tax=Streptomyces sp. CMSTAAHL-2 TaxID=2904522 RepID=UPI001E3AB03E|nr:Imm49 family immunity protein [Streptomyces sp. CMSTAAHL-2]MCE3034627.1 immunity 49 family protein [Streptomyces sp. CMSTAAHL-2]